MIKSIILTFIILMNLFTDKMQSQNIHFDNTEIITLGGGCFWCTEAVFSQIDGIIETKVGYAGGWKENPTYEEVCTGNTGHAEVCQIKFNKDKVKLTDLLEIFFNTHDPTTKDRQGNDIGSQYRSIILYHNKEQKKIAEEFIKKLESKKIFSNPIVTEIVPLIKFYPAEDYHQKYFKKNPTSLYCVFVINPKIKKTKLLFNDKLKR